MSDIKQLIRIDFDSLENRNPIKETVIGIFVGRERGLTSLGKAVEWFKKQEPIRLYLGYDGNVYPQFRLERKKEL